MEQWKGFKLRTLADDCGSGLYTDESPGLKVDPVIVMSLSLVFIFSVVALHSKSAGGAADSVNECLLVWPLQLYRRSRRSGPHEGD